MELYVILVAVMLFGIYFLTKTKEPQPQPPPQLPPQMPEPSAQLVDMRKRTERVFGENRAQKREIEKLRRDMRGMYQMVEKMNQLASNPAPPPKQPPKSTLRPYAQNNARKNNGHRVPPRAPAAGKEIKIDEDLETNKALQSWFGIS